MRLKTFLLLGILFLLLRFTSRAQMLDPAIDRVGEPFSYFSKPTDVLGVMDGRWGTLVSPEGFLYTGYGELIFFAGNPPRPTWCKIARACSANRRACPVGAI